MKFMRIIKPFQSLKLLSYFPSQVARPRLLDDVRADDQLQVRAEDGEEAPHGGGPCQGGEGE